jgi:hypothetical protein
LKLPAEPTAKVVLFALVIVGAVETLFTVESLRGSRANAVAGGRREEILKRREEQKQQTLYERFQYNLAQKNNRATGEPEVRNRSLSDGLNNSFMAA